MKIIQYTFSIPKDKQDEFVQYSKDILSPTWTKYGCRRYECVKIEDQKLVEGQNLEQDRFIERLYFDNDFNIQEFYRKARKGDPDVVRSYEKKFNANNIELRILKQLV